MAEQRVEPAEDQTVEVASDKPAAPTKKRGAGGGPGGYSWKAILLAALGVYALLLIIVNSKRVDVNFVFFHAKTRVIFLVLLSMGLGALLMWLAPRMRQKRKQEH